MFISVRKKLKKKGEMILLSIMHNWNLNREIKDSINKKIYINTLIWLNKQKYNYLKHNSKEMQNKLTAM